MHTNGYVVRYFNKINITRNKNKQTNAAFCSFYPKGQRQKRVPRLQKDQQIAILNGTSFPAIRQNKINEESSAVIPGSLKLFRLFSHIIVKKLKS